MTNYEKFFGTPEKAAMSLRALAIDFECINNLLVEICDGQCDLCELYPAPCEGQDCVNWLKLEER